MSDTNYETWTAEEIQQAVNEAFRNSGFVYQDGTFTTRPESGVVKEVGTGEEIIIEADLEQNERLAGDVFEQLEQYDAVATYQIGKDADLSASEADAAAQGRGTEGVTYSVTSEEAFVAAATQNINPDFGSDEGTGTTEANAGSTTTTTPNATATEPNAAPTTARPPTNEVIDVVDRAAERVGLPTPDGGLTPLHLAAGALLLGGAVAVQQGWI